MTELPTTVRRYVPHAVVAAIVLAVIAAVLIRRDTRVLADNIGVTAFSNGSAMVQVPYRRDGAPGTVSIMVNGFPVIEGAPARPERYWNSNFYTRDAGISGEQVRVRVTFTGPAGDEVIERDVSPTLSDEYIKPSDFEGITEPELSMKVGQTQVRQRASPTPTIPDSGQYHMANTPDLLQRPAECAPTAAANSLISLANKHGQDGKLPADSLTMIDELKGDMRWTPKNGVLPDDFVAGKNLWAAKKGLPIRTEKVGNQTGTTTLAALEEALKNGKAAELRLAFAEPVRGGFKVTGGHLVTVVGVHTTNGKTYVDIHDPKSPGGVDTHLVEGNQITDYTLYAEGVTVLSWGFTQTWTGETLEPMTDAEVQGIREFAGEKQKIKALHIGDRYIPLGQVHVSEGHAGTCEAPHWHANVPGATRDTNGKLFDELYEFCGYGKLPEVPVVDIEVR